MRKLTHDEISTRRITKEALSTVERVPLVVIVDNVRSLYNVGSIFRTSDGAMIEKVVLTGFTPRPPRKEIEKTALGATESVPWEYINSPKEAALRYKETGYKIVCLEQTDESIPYYQLAPSAFPVCLVIGNELVGVSKEVIEICDSAIDIPMFGLKHSLNVAVAFGIALFELCRIWRSNGTRSYNRGSVPLQ
ncbi:MAG: RNA methyltransferase [Bacteroidetes bacterium]|nr:RNA methyltransferase [Bacteroidota bacterium]